MSESDWVRSRDPGEWIRGFMLAASPRKRLLFASACCQRLRSVFDDAAALVLLDRLPDFADRWPAEEEWAAARRQLEPLIEAAAHTRRAANEAARAARDASDRLRQALEAADVPPTAAWVWAAAEETAAAAAELDAVSRLEVLEAIRWTYYAPEQSSPVDWGTGFFLIAASVLADRREAAVGRERVARLRVKAAEEDDWPVRPGRQNLRAARVADWVERLEDADYDEARRQAVDRAERRAQRDVLRELFTNLARPVSVDPGWLTWNDGVVQRLARAIYRDRAFDRLPVLADALEEAGCTNAELLTHCRKATRHLPGCWALDCLLDLG